jgi:hypothetical protein
MLLVMRERLENMLLVARRRIDIVAKKKPETYVFNSFVLIFDYAY